MSKQTIPTIRDVFIKLCKKTFIFLEKDFGCKIIREEKVSVEAYVTYQNNTTAVLLTFSPRDGGIFLDLIRLVNGIIPDNIYEFSQNLTLNSFDLSNVLLIRDPEFEIERPSFDELFKEKVIKSVLNQKAYVLKTYASDILKGDFSIFPQLEKIVKERAKTYSKEEKIEIKNLSKKNKKDKKKGNKNKNSNSR